MTERVLVLDPGQRIGWATAVIHSRYDEHPPVAYWLEVQEHGITPLKTMALAVYRALLEHKYDTVVMENWTLSGAHAKKLIGDDMQSSQFIGMVRLCCWVSNTKLVMQYPAVMSTARKTTTNHPSGADIQERLAKLPKSHDDSHDGSALLHLWAYFRERYV